MSPHTLRDWLADRFASLSAALAQLPDRQHGLERAGELQLVVHDEARWFKVSGGAAISCANFKLLRRLLLALSRARVDRPGEPLSASSLVAAGWPSERVMPRAARNRLHVALTRLRQLGLGELLISCPDGWLIASTVEVVFSTAPEAP